VKYTLKRYVICNFIQIKGNIYFMDKNLSITHIFNKFINFEYSNFIVSLNFPPIIIEQKARNNIGVKLHWLDGFRIIFSEVFIVAGFSPVIIIKDEGAQMIPSRVNYLSDELVKFINYKI
jgi:hypothetical protein